MMFGVPRGRTGEEGKGEGLRIGGIGRIRVVDEVSSRVKAMETSRSRGSEGEREEEATSLSAERVSIIRCDLIWRTQRSASLALLFCAHIPLPPRGGRRDAVVPRALTFGSGLGALFAFLALDFLPPFFFTGVTCDSGEG